MTPPSAIAVDNDLSAAAAAAPAVIAPAPPKCPRTFVGLRLNATVPHRVLIPSCGAGSHWSCCGRAHSAELRGLEARCARAAAASDLDAEASAECCAAYMSVRCFACDLRSQLGLVAGIDAGVCDAALKACSGVFFETDDTGASPLPCDADHESLACSRLGDIYASGAAFCDSAGLPTRTARDTMEEIRIQREDPTAYTHYGAPLSSSLEAELRSTFSGAMNFDAGPRPPPTVPATTWPLIAAVASLVAAYLIWRGIPICRARGWLRGPKRAPPSAEFLRLRRLEALHQQQQQQQQQQNQQQQEQQCGQ